MKKPAFVFIVLSVGFALAACSFNTNTGHSTIAPSPSTATPAQQTAIPSPKPTVSPSGTSLPTPVPTSTLENTATPLPSPTPVRVLTVCLGREPQSLFLYRALSASAKSVLEAVYDGPFDIRGFDFVPVLLERKPSQANGDVSLQPVEVKPGELIVDDGGNLVNLGENVVYRPSGCGDGTCAQIFSGAKSVTMDQLVVRFRLLSGIQWSDGAALTADDSVYSFEVAKSLYPLTLPDQVAHTASYIALDEQTVEWRGTPGYQNALYNTNFFSPLPRHAWGWLSTTQLLEVDISAKTPLGWGPYVIDQWTPGDHITLHRNPSYFRSHEGFPYFDNLVFRFVADSSEALSALQAGECDLADSSAMQDADMVRLLQLQQAGRLKVNIQTGSAWEMAAFGIVSLDNQHPALFGLKEVRQAVAMCIDRQKMAESLFYGQSLVSDSYVPPAHPLSNPDVRHYDFDPQEASALLDSVGWKDLDGDPATPRTAQGVNGVPDGMPLKFNYLVSPDAERPEAARILQESLAQCGIQVDVEFREAGDYLASGPEGPVFGRTFDMAQFAVQYAQPTSLEPMCWLFMSTEIPGPYPEYPKGWGGVNASGYSNLQFDAACLAALFSLPDSPQHRQAHLQAQAIFADDLPVIPLYLRLRISVSRPDLCGVSVDASTESVLWNLEAWSYDKGCETKP